MPARVSRRRVQSRIHFQYGGYPPGADPGSRPSDRSDRLSGCDLRRLSPPTIFWVQAQRRAVGRGDGGAGSGGHAKARAQGGGSIALGRPARADSEFDQRRRAACHLRYLPVVAVGLLPGGDQPVAPCGPRWVKRSITSPITDLFPPCVTSEPLSYQPAIGWRRAVQENAAPPRRRLCSASRSSLRFKLFMGAFQGERRLNDRHHTARASFTRMPAGLAKSGGPSGRSGSPVKAWVRLATA